MWSCPKALFAVFASWPTKGETMTQFTNSFFWKQTALELLLQDLVEHANRSGKVGALPETLRPEQRTNRKIAPEVTREGEEPIRFATQAGKMFAYKWDTESDVIIMRSRLKGDVTCTTSQAVLAKVQPDDREQVLATVATLRAENPIYRAVIRVSYPDGRTVWLETTGRASFDAHGTLLRVIGMAVLLPSEGKRN